jgi:hypothetical protein
VPHIHLKTLEAAISALGGGFKSLYNMFKKMFGGRFKIPVVKIGTSICNNFKNCINRIKGTLKNLRQGEMLLQGRQQMQFFPSGSSSGGYGIVKSHEKSVTSKYGVLTTFCTCAKALIDPIFKALNSVLQFAKGLLPSWLTKVLEWGGLKSLIDKFLFKAFTMGATFSVAAGFMTTTFEAGVSLEIKPWDLQIGKTGCYLGGSSGIQAVPGLTPDTEVGVAYTMFKEEGNIAGESATVSVKLDLCKIFALPCGASIGGSIVFDNSKGNLQQMWNSCKSLFGLREENSQEEALALVDVRGKKTGKYFTMEAIQTMSKEELERNILESAISFFKNGFKNIKTCLNTVFNQWIGFGPEFEAGNSAKPVPTEGSYTWDYAVAVSSDVGSFSRRRRRL